MKNHLINQVNLRLSKLFLIAPVMNRFILLKPAKYLQMLISMNYVHPKRKEKDRYIAEKRMHLVKLILLFPLICTSYEFKWFANFQLFSIQTNNKFMVVLMYIFYLPTPPTWCLFYLVILCVFFCLFWFVVVVTLAQHIELAFACIVCLCSLSTTSLPPQLLYFECNKQVWCVDASNLISVPTV